MAPERTVAITRVYHFSAAHRLANAAMSDEANEALYGACARLHGHNYYLEVTVTGTPDPLTGMAVDLGRLDAAVHRTLLDEVDHARLEDAPALAGVITTGEGLARAFWRALARAMDGARLSRVGVVETAKNRFEYRGDA
jgi:6-pyruvoyltetrahydropterin/6-carboxytetrahydropterin synthase